MSGPIPGINSNRTAETSSTQESSANKEPLRDRLIHFIREVPDEESRFTEEQTNTASALKGEILALFTPLKILELSDQRRKCENEVDDNPTDIFAIFKSSETIINACKFEKTLQALEKQEELSLLEFLKRIEDGSQSLWEPCTNPDYQSEKNQTRSQIKFLRLNPSTTSESESINLLTRTKSFIEQEDLQKCIDEKQEVINQKKNQCPELPEEAIELAALPTEQIDLQIKSGSIDPLVGLTVVKYKSFKVEIELLENKIEALNHLNDFTETEPLLALKGAEVYLDHLFDQDAKMAEEEQDRMRRDTEMMALNIMMMAATEEECIIQ